MQTWIMSLREDRKTQQEGTFNHKSNCENQKQYQETIHMLQV